MFLINLSVFGADEYQYSLSPNLEKKIEALINNFKTNTKLNDEDKHNKLGLIIQKIEKVLPPEILDSDGDIKLTTNQLILLALRERLYVYYDELDLKIKQLDESEAFANITNNLNLENTLMTSNINEPVINEPVKETVIKETVIKETTINESVKLENCAEKEGEYQKTYCYNNLAYQTKDINYCSGAKGQEVACMKRVDEDKTNPLETIAKICSNISNQLYKGVCYAEMGIFRSEIVFCEKAVGKESYCLRNVDKEKNNPLPVIDKVCSVITNDHERGKCFTENAVNRLEITFCEKAIGKEYECAKLVDKDKNISLTALEKVCNTIIKSFNDNKEYYKQLCYSELGIYRGEISFCTKSGPFQKYCELNSKYNK